MSETPPASARATAAWVRYAVDYGGLAAWLATLVITRNAVASSWVIVGASILALAIGLIMERRIAPMPLVTAVLGLIFGGLTLFFHDERFIKVKPTILYSAFGLFLLTGLLRGKNPLKALMGDAFHLPDAVVRILTLRYALVFFALGLFQIPGRGGGDFPVRAQPGAPDDEAYAGRGDEGRPASARELRLNLWPMPPTERLSSNRRNNELACAAASLGDADGQDQVCDQEWGRAARPIAQSPSAQGLAEGAGHLR